MSENKPPVAKIDAFWPIVGSIWENTTDDGRIWFNFTLKRAYKKDGGYHDASTFSADHAKSLNATIDACWKWLMTDGRKRAQGHNKTVTATSSSHADTEDIPF